MALPPNLPPQAYTRDTLVKAIEWLTTQPAAVRERANSADLIVSHYLASRRRTPYLNDSALTDFKMLAEDIRQLDLPPAAPATFAPPEPEPAPVPAPAPYVAMAADFSPTPRSRRREAPRAPSAQTSLPMDFDPPAAQMPTAPTPTPVAPAPPAPVAEPETQIGHARGVPEAEAGPRGFTWSVDQRSRTIAREVQDRMNLSSESEALRMLVAMGAERLRSVLP